MKFIDTFIRSSQRMKLIWHDAEGLDEDEHEDESDEPLGDEDDEDELEEVASAVLNQDFMD